MELQAKQLTCVKGGRILFRNLSFNLFSAQLMLIKGENGAGKSTLLRMLAGLLTPNKGKIDYKISPDKQLAYLGHQNGLHLSLTVLENIHLLLSLSDIKGDTKKINALLTELALVPYANMPCEQLSQGQRRKVALCALAAKGVSLWLLDEPMTALDARSIDCFQQMLDQHLHQGGSAILATHTELEYPTAHGVINLSALKQSSIC